MAENEKQTNKGKTERHYRQHRTWHSGSFPVGQVCGVSQNYEPLPSVQR